MRHAVAGLGAVHKFIEPHCPWQNGKVERYNRTLQIEWAYRQIFVSNAERTAALAPGWSSTTLDVTQSTRRSPAGQSNVTNVVTQSSRLQLRTDLVVLDVQVP